MKLPGGRSLTRRGILFASAAVVALALAGGIAFATSHNDGDTLTGCLTKGGSIINVAINSEDPLKPCNADQTKISWNEVGQDGADGADGADGVSGWEIVQAVTPRDTDRNKSAEAVCSPGKLVLGGGVGPGTREGYNISVSRPQVTNPGLIWNRWEGSATRLPGEPVVNWQLRVWAICADVS